MPDLSPGSSFFAKIRGPGNLIFSIFGDPFPQGFMFPSECETLWKPKRFWMENSFAWNKLMTNNENWEVIWPEI